jgi:hypothetical protein
LRFDRVAGILKWSLRFTQDRTKLKSKLQQHSTR